LVVERRPFWPSRLALARFLPGLRQRFLLLTIRPFLPPYIFRMNLETGASGMSAKVERMPP